ncbi:hypothetical protein CLV28_2675 [Sediminihabitans luteus]|uniref:Methyltransferase family protein n=1 Tax=Sediminihabitans luteus TaxID=1138585 RepID=A0A2M9CD19_9CELL|nr:class I SAM-dependent methyltransferase [Sediminihabitans luteus]PJJ69213.1 hypothetical protein CLV28_2675 [Sediminihabitans luteus]GII98888.1 methyltransferase [Sediminihabitans luteus]
MTEELPLPDRDAPFEDHLAWARATPADVAPDLVARRCTTSSTRWDYADVAADAVRYATGPVLDLGTGTGDLFSTLAPFPEGSAATEAWHPHLALARRRLEPLGVEVRPVGPGVDDGLMLPFLSARFSVVLDRHEAFDPDEVARVLAPGGTFVTEQVDSRDGIRINTALGAPLPWGPDDVTLEGVVADVESAGLVVDDVDEHDGTRTFRDLATFCWYLRAAPWQVPALADLSPAGVARFEAPLRALHLHFASGRDFVDEAPRFVVRAHRRG